MVLIYGLVAVNCHEVFATACQIAVEVGGCDCDGLVLGKTTGSLAESGESHWQMLVELVLESVINIFFEFVDFIPQRLALVEGERLDFDLEFGNALLIGLYCTADIGADIGNCRTQLIVALLLELGGEGVDRRVDKRAVTLFVSARF